MHSTGRLVCNACTLPPLSCSLPTVSQVDAQLQQLRATQSYLYWRERRHRMTVDSTNKRWAPVQRPLVLQEQCISMCGSGP